jgi:hypothetical protein
MNFDEVVTYLMFAEFIIRNLILLLKLAVRVNSKIKDTERKLDEIYSNSKATSKSNE